MSSPGIDATIDRFFQPVADAVAGVVFYSVRLAGADVPLIICGLVLAALFFTVYLGFINVRGFTHALAIIRGQHNHPNDPGAIPPFQALTTALSGTVGIGNIAGVAITVSIGGPGTLFWLVLAGLMGMSVKFVEGALGVKYRRVKADGSVSGGPMYYLQYGLEKRGWPRFGRGLGLFYAAALVVGCLGIGNMFQANQAFIQLVEVTGGQDNSFLADKGWLIGTLQAVLVGCIIIGGIRSIARVTGKLVPFMLLIYVLGALAVLIMNRAALPAAITSIWQHAFSMEGMAGGWVGIMILGFRRAAFSNEAGLGSAAIAHAAVQTDKPLTEGFVALLEPFIDTVIICTLTGLVLVTSFPAETLTAGGMSGIELSSAAFESRISWFPIPLSVAAMLFAFSTMIAWAYYGMKGWTYLFGEGKQHVIIFNGIFCLCIVIGASVTLGAILDLADALIYVMALPNMLGLVIMAPEIKADLQDYWRQHRKISARQTM